MTIRPGQWEHLGDYRHRSLTLDGVVVGREMWKGPGEGVPVTRWLKVRGSAAAIREFEKQRKLKWAELYRDSTGYMRVRWPVQQWQRA